MALYLEIIQGEQKGAKFKVAANSRLGRNMGEIALNDKKISSHHAQIEKKPDGSFYLVDKNSTNGILIKGERVKSVLLAPGVTFTVGRTVFKVEEGADFIESKNVVSLSIDPEKFPNGWLRELATETSRLMGENKPQENKLFPFAKLVKLEFLSGVQARKISYLGYGPRKFGAKSLDIELLDPQAPGLAFEIMPDGQNIKIQTQHEDVIFLNDSPFSENVLNDSDLIRFGSTEIRVSLLSVE